MNQHAQTQPILSVEGLTFAYPDGPAILRDVSFAIPAGQLVALIGVNGSGKTTLLRHLIGLLHPDEGRVIVNGMDTRTTTTARLARQIGFAFQKPEHQLFSATVRDEIAFGPRNLGLRGTALKARVDDTLEQFALASIADHPPAVLSFSYRRLIALASIAALQAPVLVLDEPLVGLDGQWRRRVIAWLEAHRAAGGTTLMATHHLRLAAKAERVMVLRRGVLAADGPPAEVFANPDMLHAAGLAEPFSVALGRALALPGPTLRIRDLLAALLADGIET
ncbi:MAG: energy-coupling factor ABC transporter ATP-binding protein [Anaerolineae bacterium]|nr:energy-coupling factor ABC transporter ATP-binding protein [Anaerolineae bacterium]